MKFSLPNTEGSGPADAATPALSTPPTPAQPFAGGLPQVQRPGREPRPRRRILLGLVVLAVAAAAVVAGVPSLNKPIRELFAASTTEIVTSPPLRKGMLTVTVNEKGNLESAKNEDVLCEVEGSTTIISILARGHAGQEGRQVVCELDSATLKDNLKNQQITTQQADGVASTRPG